ncbi:MAG TPA: hypothetical protein VIJ93_04225 [bacterium]
MKVLFIMFILWLGYQPLFADTPSDNEKTQTALKGNVVDFRDWLMKQLSQFPKIPQGNPGVLPRRFASNPQKNRVFTANQYNKAAKSDWVKAQVMKGLSTLSQQLANTAGTIFAPQSASQLQLMASQLKQSDDPQFQKIGTLYTQEAQVLQAGDIQGADQAANQVAAVPQPYVPPGYQPTQSESETAQIFKEILGTIITAVATYFGGYLGTIASSLFTKAIFSSSSSGQNSGTASTNASSNTLSTGGSAALQQLGDVTVKQLQNQGSANAGGAPPAQ